MFETTVSTGSIIFQDIFASPDTLNIRNLQMATRVASVRQISSTFEFLSGR